MSILSAKYIAGIGLAVGIAIGLGAASSANAAPITLDGLGIVGQWTDYEQSANDMPSTPWGTSDTDDANRVGIYVEYANGLTGSASYTGAAGLWNQCCTTIAGPDTFSGFFTSNAILHGLNNTGSGLPMAWTILNNAFTNNFDLDYSESFGSEWRANTSGWDYVEITLYSTSGRVIDTEVPEPASLGLLGLGLVGIGLMRRKARKTA